MKTKLELLFVSLLMSFSYLYAQTAPLDYIVDIETKKLTGYDLIKKIEKQSGYFISYSESVFEVPQNIVLQKSKESISFFLDILFKFSEQREYVVKGRKILIKSNKKKQNRASENIKNALMISAKLIDSVSNDAVGYATVQIINQTLGTISNEEGKFEFIIPKSLVNNKIQINCIGYENKVMIIKTLLAEPSRSIKLTPKTYQLGDVKVKPKNALEIFKRAIRSIPDNYPTKPIFLDAFMRTLIKENNHYVRLTEAASKVYYSGYGQPIDKKKQEKKFFGAENTDVSKLWPSYYDLYTDSMDQAKIIQARISKDYSRLLRTRFVSGGPLGILASDKVKYPNEFTDNQHFKRYRFKLEDITSYKNKRVYVISFSPKNNQKDRSPGHKRRVYSLKFRKAPFKGRIYSDIESLAFISFQYELARPEIFKNMFWKWGQLSYQVRIDYKQYNGKWYLHQIKKTDKQIEMAMDNKQKSKMDTLEVHSQILINNIHLEKVKPFDSTEVFPHSYSKTLYSYPESYNKNFWSNYTTTTSTELEKEVLNDLSIDENLEDQFTSTQVRNDSMNAPVAKTVVKCDTLQNDIFCDGYSWMEVDSSQELMDHLLHENRYFKNYMIPTRSIQKKVQKEMVERSTLDKNVSYRMVGDYFYYERYNRYGSYKLLCRKKGSISGAEEVLLDYSNLANRHDYFDVFDYEMSPDQTKLLLLVDFKGSESYTGYIYEIQPAPVLIDSLVDVQNIVWTNSGKSFYYVKYNKNLLAKDVYFHEITQNQNNDKLVYKEPGKYYLGLYSDDKNKYLFLVRTNNFETEIKCRKLDEKWDSNFKTICPLRKGHYYIIDKIGEHIYILSNKNKTNSQIFKVHISTPYENNWQLVYENNEEELIKNFSIYDGHLVMMTTKNAFDRIHILNLKTQKEKQNQNLLVSIISHDLRSKLSSMFPAIRLLEMNNKKDENRENDAEIINLLKASLKGSLSMLDGLLEWGKMITGRTQINREKLNICNIASKVKTELNEVMADKQITITDTSDKELLVYADRVLLEVLIRNLLSNAIKFSYVNGQIEMSCQVISDELVKNQKNVFSSNRLIKDRSMVLFSIKDNGTGISEKRFSKILKAENVGSVAGTLGEKGSGLGLLICKEIIEKHDGHIWAESEEEKGSTFFFAIPEANSIA